MLIGIGNCEYSLEEENDIVHFDYGRFTCLWSGIITLNKIFLAEDE